MCIRDSPDGYTPRARRVLERAAQEAQALSSAQIGTEHLLLAILKEMCIRDSNRL